MKVTKKGEAKYNKCKMRKNKYKIHANVVKKRVRKNRHYLGLFLIRLESDFRVSIFQFHLFKKIQTYLTEAFALYVTEVTATYRYEYSKTRTTVSFASRFSV